MTSDARLLIVHAHPDDESIGTGATMAKYVAEGASVTLVTCTLGEEGEVLIPELAHLAADHDDSLGEHRITELTDAMAILGVTDFRFLGGAGKYRDSGMMGVESNQRADCFWQCGLAGSRHRFSRQLFEKFDHKLSPPTTTLVGTVTLITSRRTG